MSFRRLISIIPVFVLCCVFWVFFRANSLSDAFYIFGNSLDGIASGSYFAAGLAAIGMRSFTAAKLVLLIALLLAFDWISLKRDVIAAIGQWPPVWRWCVYVAVVLMLIWLTPGNSSEFIYFAF